MITTTDKFRLGLLVALAIFGGLAAGLLHHYNRPEFVLPATVTIIVNVIVALIGGLLGLTIGHKAKNLAANLLIFLGVMMMLGFVVVVPVILHNADSTQPPQLAVVEAGVWVLSFMIATVLTALIESDLSERPVEDREHSNS